ncbi:UNVERIFIED_CONTAM: hypothetical protein PYX00_007419 [Menopon gallinae]|uniref:ATP synthase-coupling factor 6, mitochondrial n=1 Tax=Menopon gallinae TaxID=328185 RepID=A0AAW2HJM2_9NEOP
MQAPILRVVKEVPKVFKRNIGVTYTVYQTDPIQQLFVDKLREYRKKSQGGKPVEMTPDVQKELKNDLARIEKQYGASGDMTKFPKLEFAEPVYDPINVKNE